MLCIASAGTIAALVASSFTLSWTHSVEHTQWRESWVVQGDSLQLVEASVEGPGAGIAVPADAVWADGRWSYRPTLPPMPSLNLAASGMTPSPWRLCTSETQCLSLGAKAGESARVWADRSCD